MLKDFVPADERMEQGSETGHNQRQYGGREKQRVIEIHGRRGSKKRVGWQFGVKYFIQSDRLQY